MSNYTKKKSGHNIFAQKKIDVTGTAHYFKNREIISLKFLEEMLRQNDL